MHVILQLLVDNDAILKPSDGLTSAQTMPVTDGRPPLPNDVPRAGSRGEDDAREASPMSEITADTLHTPHNNRHNRTRLDRLSLADLAANSPITPVRNLGEFTEAELEQFKNDLMACELNPGAEDSDDDEDVADSPADAEVDRKEHIADDLAVELSEYCLPQANEDDNVTFPGAPIGWKPPSAPDNWMPMPPKIEMGEPTSFEDVDNPGNWSDFTMRPKFDKKTGKYLYHCLPTGATVVPEDDEGNRSVNGWKFVYDGSWKDDGSNSFRSGATKQIMFPESRKGSLCRDKLTLLGLTAGRMRENEDNLPDSLFFYQLLLPVHDTKRTVTGDPRQSFYQDVAKWSNLYAIRDLGIGVTGYGTTQNTVGAAEFLQWDGSIVMDGVLGGSDGAIYRRFDSRKGNTNYCKHIAETFSRERWHHIKRIVKLCDNDKAIKRGQVGYEPAYKYDYIFDTLVHNVNALTFKVDSDQCLDETSFGFNGWGEAGAGLVNLIANKPGITRGAQIVLSIDVGRLRPRAYVHRHKKHHEYYKQRGPNEVRLIHEKLKKLQLILHTDHLHITADNFFSGDSIFAYAAAEGFGLTTTVRRDRLPKDIPAKYVMKEKTDSSARPKAARFQQPIFCLKEHTVTNEEASISKSMLQLCSFQSTSSCNIMCINALNSCSLYAEPKERGRGKHKRTWAIEMNEARRLYLDTYGVVDQLDHYISYTNMKYR